MKVETAVAKPSQPVPSPAPSSARPHGNEGGDSFAKVLHGLGNAVTRGERIMHVAEMSGGRDLSSGELLALQTGVYRYSEAVDLTSKLVDHATTAVKTVIQGQ